MALDEALKRQLVDAREKIIAQLNEIEFRSTESGFARRGVGPPDYRIVYAELQDELRQINDMLGIDEPYDRVYRSD